MAILRLVGATVLGGGAYATYKATSLSQQYPLTPASDIQNRPGILAVIPEGNGAFEVVSTTIQAPPARARADPIGTTIDAFYAGWTLRLEAWASRRYNLVGRRPSSADKDITPPLAYASGIFQVIHREPDSVTVLWSAPGASEETAVTHAMPEGVQVIAAQLNDNGGLDISYACAQDLPPGNKLVYAVMMKFHHVYMRFLLDETKKRLEQWAREGQ